jgi:hypothetical protein
MSGRIILKFILEECDAVIWIGFTWLMIVPSGGMM